MCAQGLKGEEGGAFCRQAAGKGGVGYNNAGREGVDVFSGVSSLSAFNYLIRP